MIYAAQKSTPDAAAEAVEELAVTQGLTQAVGSGTSSLGTALTGTESGLSASVLPSWADGLAGLLSALTSANTWIRVSKVIIGGVLVIVGLVHVTGADNAVATAARKVPLPV